MRPAIAPRGLRQRVRRDHAVDRRRLHERDHSRRRLWHAPLPGDAGRLEAAAAGVRQADGVLPAVDLDARRHPRHPHHLDAAGHAALPRPARRRRAVGHSPELRGTAQARGHRAGVHRRARVRRQGAGRARARRQHLLRQRAVGAPAARGQARARRHRVRLPGEGSAALRRGRVRRERTGGEHRGKAAPPEVALRGRSALFLRQLRARHRREAQALGARRARDHRRQPRLPGAGRARSDADEPRLRLARHGHPRDAARSLGLHRDSRAPAGPEDRLPRGDRLPHGIHRRAAAGSARQAAGEERLRAISEERAEREAVLSEGDPDRPARGADSRAESIQRLAREFLRGLQPAHFPRGHGPRRRVRAGQRIAFGAQRAARPALPDQAAAGQAGARRGGRDLRRGGRPAPQLADVRQVDRRDPLPERAADDLDPAGFRARLPGALRAGDRQLQDDRLLRAAARAHARVERPLRGCPVAARGPAAPQRQGREGDEVRQRRDLPLRILLTGRNGQVGWELERKLAPLGEVIATDRSTLDLADPDQIRRAVREAKPEVIVNAAAYTAVDTAESEPELAMRINGFAPGVLAEEAKRLGALLVHYSTDYVFDGEKATPYVEDDPPNPINVYGRTKLEGERAIGAADCRHLILRTSWVYGARGKNFLLTILRLAREGRELRVVDDQIGAPTASFAIAQATAQLVRASARGLYHLCAAGAASWCGFARAIVAHAGIAASVTAIRTEDYPTLAKRPRNSRLDCSKLRAKQSVSLAPWDEALAEVMAAR